MLETNLITGANGFLGKHLSAKLGDFTAIPHPEIQTTNLPRFDNFYFLSTYGNMAYHDEDQWVTKANISDLISVLNQVDFSKSFNSFVFVSSSSVGLTRKTMYSRTKKAAEEILLAYKEKYNVPICIVRPFSITGVGEQPEHLIPALIRSCMSGAKMDFVANAVHDFIDVEDVVDGMLNLSENNAKGIYELGTGTRYTNRQVLDLVEGVTGKKANITEVPSLRDYDNEDWVSTNFRARSYGWLPKKTLKQSVEEMVRVYEA